MAHVTFIHGIANKPPQDVLLRQWRDALARGSAPLPLIDLGVTSTMVYWADLLYAAPDPDESAHEGVLENTPNAIDASGSPPPPEAHSIEEAAFIEALRARMTALSESEIADAPPDLPAEPAGTLERVPLPWPLKKAFMNTFLRDVHHYLFDVEFGPPGKPAVHIQQAIRKRFVEALSAPSVTRPHVVVAHSMGTVIAYDCLKRVADCPAVDGLITIGSPLGLDEVQDKLQPGWTRADGYPSEKLARQWLNGFDRLDPVCGFDPSLANDFQRRSAAAVNDVAVQNEGAWRHSGVKYLGQPAISDALRALLGV